MDHEAEESPIMTTMDDRQRIKVAVTGADGLIGGVLRAGLSGRFEPRWLTRAEADITDMAALERSFRGTDAVVHLAATPDVEATEAALIAEVGFAIVNGVSDNPGRWLSLDEGRGLIGWEPLDGELIGRK